jgi:predicted ATPase
MTILYIKHIEVNNFKSLVDFKLPLAKFSCLVGLNSSGKSTVLQFLDFLSQQIKGDLDGWLKSRQWQPGDLSSKLTGKQNITFNVILAHQDGFEVRWTGSFNRQTLRCTTEGIVWNDKIILVVTDGIYTVGIYTVGKERQKIAFDYQGSLLSQLRESQLPPELLELKRFMKGLNALDLLNPELLRQRARVGGDSLGLGGEKLSAFLAEISAGQRQGILDRMKKIYPQFQQFDVAALKSGWKKLTVREIFGEVIVNTEARHVADGFLRMLAVFAQLSKEQSFLLLDEIENGVNPELIEFLVDELVAAKSQVLVTTHSPLVLNYLTDEVAIDGVIYLYKNPQGATQAIKLFEIPSMAEKLTVMGAGEVYEDTLLTQLNAEILEGR